MNWACSLKVTVAKAMVPSLLTWVAAVACSSGVAPAGGYGLATLVTWGTWATLSSMVVMVAWTSGSEIFFPSEVWKTICSESPACFGAAAWSRAMASVDSVWGSEKLLE